MTNPRPDHVFDAAERIVEEATMDLMQGVRVRIFFPGGPAEPVRIHARGEWTDLEIPEGDFIKLHTRSIVGWQRLEG